MILSTLETMIPMKVWYGGVTTSKTNIEIFGIRPDQTIEVWVKKRRISRVISYKKWNGEELTHNALN